MLLNGKKIFITGATGDIGCSICEDFLHNGAILFLSGTNNDKLNELKSRLLLKFPDGESKIFIKSCNLANENEIVDLVKEANKTMSGIDVLVGNAGITNDALAIKMTKNQWNDVININLTANFILSRECIKIMIKQRSGKIINIASIVGIYGNVGQVNYSASKAGLIAMTKTLSKEYAKFGITANCVAPGFIETRMTNKIQQSDKENFLKRIPLQRFGNVKDISNVCLFLASNLSDYINGQTISVDGGIAV